MIGAVRLPSGVTVELGDDYVWRSRSPVWASLFNAKFSPYVGDHSAAGLPFGNLIVADAARQTGGTPVLRPLQSLPRGVVS